MPTAPTPPPSTLVILRPQNYWVFKTDTEVRIYLTRNRPKGPDNLEFERSTLGDHVFSIPLPDVHWYEKLKAWLIADIWQRLDQGGLREKLDAPYEPPDQSPPESYKARVAAHHLQEHFPQLKNAQRLRLDGDHLCWAETHRVPILDPALRELLELAPLAPRD